MLSMHPRHRVSATNPLFYFILFIFDKLKIFFFYLVRSHCANGWPSHLLLELRQEKTPQEPQKMKTKL